MCFLHWANFFSWKWTWKSLSSVWLFVTPSTVHGILQARILEWVAFPYSKGSSQPRNRTQVSHIAGGFFTSWTQGKPKNTGGDIYPFSSRSSQPRDRTGVSCIAGRYFTNWAIRERGFIEERYLKTKTWVLGVLIAIGISLLLAFCQSIQLGNICMPTNSVTWLRW